MVGKIPGLNLHADVQIGQSNQAFCLGRQGRAPAEVLDARLIGLSAGRNQRESVFEDTEPVKT